MKILIVEDDENSRVLLESSLESNGYKIKSAENGEIALTLAISDPPDMIISDILMPKMDGYALCKAVKTNEKLCHIPFIFYTATYTDAQDEKLAMDLGASKFIIKPVEIDILLSEIKSILKKNKAKELPIPITTSANKKNLEKDYSTVLAKKLDHKIAQLQKEKEKLAESEKQLLEALTKAEESNKLKSCFLSTISHEIRTPLNIILGYSDIMLDEKIDKKQQDCLKKIRTAGNDLLYVLTSILDMAMIETNETIINNAPFSLKLLFETISDTLKKDNTFKTKNISLNKQIAEGIDDIIIGDMSKLTKILTNLLKNSIKFTHEGHIEYGVILKDEMTLEFFVKDTGIGIPKNKINNLFQSFTQIDMSNTRKYSGLGIGLALCKGLVSLMGGKIDIKSKTGENSGTTVSFTTPYKQKEKGEKK